MPDNILTVSHLYAGYKKTEILHDVSFEIKAGEVVGLIGLNGAGKTTLLKTIVGLRDISKGKIEKPQGEIAFLPERFDAPSFLTGFEYVRFYLKAYGQALSLEDARQHADIISLSQEALPKRINTYSKGMRQKIGILATMIAHAPLKILDEPMSGLDPKARYEVKSLIKQASSRKHSVLMSSHILSDIAVLCDKVMVLHQGQLLFTGTPNELSALDSQGNIENAFLSVIERKSAA